MKKQINRDVQTFCIKCSNTFFSFQYLFSVVLSQISCCQFQKQILRSVIKDGWKNTTNGVHQHHHIYYLNIYLFSQICELKYQFSRLMNPWQLLNMWFQFIPIPWYRINPHYIVSHFYYYKLYLVKCYCYVLNEIHIALVS